ncbi:hypothetical protein [Cochlodiniinecator piscidefendens]|uniref:hypothetical protein n=1 Tax=Cochlodiniinecator piscidefendens TaxID=2715756 RepID=UPI00140B6E5C|nr:hypothetical protein [Cochlodiniinecator piscidefendens]
MPVIDPILVNTTTAGNQVNPKAAQNKFGEIAVCWTQRKLTGVRDHDQIIVQLYDATGQKIGGELLINDAASNVDAKYSPSQSLAGLYPQSDGTFIVAMTGAKSSSNGIIQSAFARKINRDGTFSTDLTEIIDTTADGSISPPYMKIHVTSEGIAVTIAYMTPTPTVTYPWSGLYGSIFDLNTTNTPTWMPLDTQAALIGHPRYIHHIDEKTIGIVSHQSGNIYHSQFDIEAKSVVESKLLITETSTFSNTIELHNGYFANFWGAGGEAFAQVFEPNGTPYTKTILAPDLGTQVTKTAFRDTLNGFHWVMYGPVDGSNSYYEFFNKYGGAEYTDPRLCEEFIIKKPSEFFGLPLHDGGHLKVWTSSYGTPLDDDDGYGVYMARFDKTNTPVNVDTPFTLEYLAQNTGVPASGSGGTGGGTSGGTGGGTSGGTGGGTGSVSCCASGVNITVHVHNNDDCCGS